MTLAALKAQRDAKQAEAAAAARAVAELDKQIEEAEKKRTRGWELAIATVTDCYEGIGIESVSRLKIFVRSLPSLSQSATINEIRERFAATIDAEISAAFARGAEAMREKLIHSFNDSDGYHGSCAIKIIRDEKAPTDSMEAK